MKNKRRKKIIRGTSERPRLLIFRSNKTIYGQLIDDVKQVTLFTVSGLSKNVKDEVSKVTSKVKASEIVGEHVAAKAKKFKVSKVVFDRNGYLYHGRVKALADGARKGGLEF